MSVAHALRKPFQLLERRLPDRLPPLTGKPLWVFRLLWLALFALALVGPLGGIFVRLSEPLHNSLLVLGSRIGVAVSPQDSTQVRFPVGPYSREGGSANAMILSPSMAFRFLKGLLSRRSRLSNTRMTQPTPR